MADINKDVMYKRNYLDTIGKLILNNKQYSDITFVVNKKHYHASRIIMSASSEVLRQHLNNVADKEIILQDIKHHESFFHILQYIHGVEINLTKMSKVALCEMLNLSKRYKLREVFTDLKCYFSKIKRFKMNSVVTMMNTAKKYELTVLYERLKIYVFLHTEEVIKHKSFVNFQFDVLEDLLKSDWLYTKEIDILRAALSWHDENMVDVEAKVNTEAEEETGSEGNVDELIDDDVDSETDESWGEIVEEFLSNYSEDFFDCDEHVDVQNENTNCEDQSSLTDENIKSEINRTIGENHVENANIPNPDIHCQIDNTEININSNGTPTKTGSIEQIKAKSGEEVVETFSKKILKMLLGHIRFIRINLLEFTNVMEVKPFRKYKTSIFDQGNNPNQKNDERKKHKVVIAKKFTVKGINNEMELGKLFTSEERIDIENITWFVQVYLKKVPSNDHICLAIYLLGKGSNKEWACYVNYRTTLISYKLLQEDVHNESCTRIFSESKGWGWTYFITSSELFNPDNAFVRNDTITLEVEFRFIQNKTIPGKRPSEEEEWGKTKKARESENQSVNEK